MSNPITLRIMEKKNFINAELVRSNASRSKVWMVTTEGWEPRYCKNAKNALRYIFMLKRSTGAYVSEQTIQKLRLEIALNRKTDDSPLATIRQQIADAKKINPTM